LPILSIKNGKLIPVTNVENVGVEGNGGNVFRVQYLFGIRAREGF
jgi:hypothetical protein